MTPKSVSHLLTGLSCSFDGTRPNGSIFLSIPTGMLHRLVKEAGAITADISARTRHPMVYAEVTPDLLAYLNDCMVYACNAMTATQHYYLELLDNNRLLCKYQSILGSRTLTTLDDVEVATLGERIVPLFREKALTVKPKPGTRAYGGASLEAELMRLTADVFHVYMPTDILANYAAIKALLQKAGGVYAKNKFVFEEGVDATEVLAQLQKGEEVNPKKQFQFFATPLALAKTVCEAAGNLSGKRVLEPSAGDGVLADLAQAEGAEVTCVETWEVNVNKLRDKKHAVVHANFLELSPTQLGLFDAIVANPPFSKNQDIDHVLHMLKFLKPGGTLSTIMSSGWMEERQAKHAAFVEFVSKNGLVSTTDVPAGTFAESGTQVTSVHVVIRKPDAYNDAQQSLAA